jgi:CTP synthase (UTP-ammonia lyase)
MSARIALVGDRDEAVVAHRAIPRALAAAADAERLAVVWEWVPTEEIRGERRLAGFDALWCVPATPYRSMDGALLAIRTARTDGIPFLGTCGGFQHAAVEYARAVLGWADAEHAETAPEASRPVVTPLHCALVERTGTVRFRAGSRVAAAYGRAESVEGYHCRYGLAPAFQQALASGPLRATAEDDAGDVRAIELDGHPFFVATLFQPERAALAGTAPPLVRACGRAAHAARAARAGAALEASHT